MGTSMDARMPLPSPWGLIPNTSSGFERVTSADHTSFEAGENVAASTSGSTTVFDESNPHYNSTCGDYQSAVGGG